MYLPYIYQSTAYEGVLFSFAVYKAVTNALRCQETQRKHVSLYHLLVRDNLLYFLAYAFYRSGSLRPNAHKSCPALRVFWFSTTSWLW